MSRGSLAGWEDTAVLFHCSCSSKELAWLALLSGYAAAVRHKLSDAFWENLWAGSDVSDSLPLLCHFGYWQVTCCEN